MCVCVFLSFVSVFLRVMCAMGLVPEIKLMYVCTINSVVTNSSTYYLNTIANSQEFSLFKIVFQYPIGVNYFNSI